MKLSQYLVSNNISQSDFAQKLGTCQATIHKYLYKHTVPSGLRILQIHQLTNGEVTVEDWVQLHADEINGQSATR